MIVIWFNLVHTIQTRPLKLSTDNTLYHSEITICNFRKTVTNMCSSVKSYTDALVVALNLECLSMLIVKETSGDVQVCII